VVEVLGPDLVGEAVGDQSFCGERFPSVIFEVSSRSVNLRVSGVALTVSRFSAFRVRNQSPTLKVIAIGSSQVEREHEKMRLKFI
jgi:hypothetical protein